MIYDRNEAGDGSLSSQSEFQEETLRIHFSKRQNFNADFVYSIGCFDVFFCKAERVENFGFASHDALQFGFINLSLISADHEKTTVGILSDNCAINQLRKCLLTMTCNTLHLYRRMAATLNTDLCKAPEQKRNKKPHIHAKTKS